ncbi:MAG: TIGR01212 family radical SAM protein [Spirochaetales bacterium]|nr:TIGR01212 family radical SAM protein [Spirochaetales bacterium]
MGVNSKTKEKALSIPESADDYPYTSYARILKEKYGKRVYRVGVDGGFSCPNRPSGRSSPGCTYCDGFGALSTYQRDGEGVEERRNLPSRLEETERQIRRGIMFLQHRYKAEFFILYFQAFSGTFDTPENLKRLYDHGLSCHPFVELVVSTRPDCVDEEKAALLRSYKTAERDVWVELGLQSARDATLQRIRRGHNRRCFEKAFRLLKDHGLKTAVHLIFGLPGEDWKDIEYTIRYLRDLDPEGVKIHNLHIPAGTALAEEYLSGELSVPSLPRHLDYTLKALELLPREVVLLRLTCDTPDNRLVAPRGTWAKAFFYQQVLEEMKRRQTYQGRLAGQ